MPTKDVSKKISQSLTKMLVRKHGQLDYDDFKALKPVYRLLIQAFLAELRNNVKHNKISARKLAKQFGIESDIRIKELMERAVVLRAKELFSGNIRNDFESMVALYELQMGMNQRTTQSIIFKQYSTPCPISYLAGKYISIEQFVDAKYFEPSAGNGMMALALPEKYTVVNEIDPQRNFNLEQFSNYKEIKNIDASLPFGMWQFDGIITNPPFAKLSSAEIYDGSKIRYLEHKMAILALECLKYDGKAAIIIGGHNEFDVKGRFKAGKNREFFMYLYRNYHVATVINIDGSKLYRKQGTSFDTRLILIKGCSNEKGLPPIVKEEKHDLKEVVSTWERLYERVMEVL